jgi:hypothetical protein
VPEKDTPTVVIDLFKADEFVLQRAAQVPLCSGPTDYAIRVCTFDVEVVRVLELR